MASVVYLRDRFVEDGAEPVVALTDAGYLLGDGVFATLRGYEGICFRAADHVEDFLTSARVFGIAVDRSPRELIALVDEVARRTGEADAYVRLTLSRGTPEAGPTLSVLGRAMPLPGSAHYRQGIDVTVVAPRRIPPACGGGSIKSSSYALPVLARREAEGRGFTEGLQLALDGRLACATMANVFAIVGDRLVTPSLETGCRDGVTRRMLLRLAKDEHLEPVSADLTLETLFGADETFVSSTRVECLPIASIDGRPLAARAHFPRTAALRARLRALALAETASRRPS